jgi:hypothetical protein
MHVCTHSHDGNDVFDKNLPCHLDALLQPNAPFRQDIVLGVEPRRDLSLHFRLAVCERTTKEPRAAARSSRHPGNLLFCASSLAARVNIAAQQFECKRRMHRG